MKSVIFRKYVSRVEYDYLSIDRSLQWLFLQHKLLIKLYFARDWMFPREG